MISFLSTSTPLTKKPNTPILFDIISSEKKTQTLHKDPFPYPPPFQVKQDEWYMSNPDLFLSIRGKLYGLQREKFPRTCLFLENAYKIHENELYPRGFTPTRPFPINQI